jgi:hypothetical protein
VHDEGVGWSFAGRKTTEVAPISHIGQRGTVGTRALLWVLSFSLALYAGYIAVPPYVAHRMLKAEVKAAAEHAHQRTDDAIVRNILEKSKSWSIPIKKKDVLVRRSFDSIAVNIDYSVELVFFDQYVKVVKFKIDVNVPLKESSGVLH